MAEVNPKEDGIAHTVIISEPPLMGELIERNDPPLDLSKSDAKDKKKKKDKAGKKRPLLAAEQ